MNYISQQLPLKLDTTFANILREEQRILNQLRLTLAKFGVDAEDMIALSNSIQQLDEFFMLVVVGEFNAGKSTFINALVGQPILKEGVTPTTNQITILRHGLDVTADVDANNIKNLTFPVDFLQNLTIVDTPGTNTVIREHSAITNDFIPRADLVLFVTSADQPFSDSEREFLSEICEWGKKIIIVLNKIDILDSPAELSKIKQFILDHADTVLGEQPFIFPVSSRYALRAKLGEAQYWQGSLFEPIEDIIMAKLDKGKRLRLKLLNPLGVGEHLVERYKFLTRIRLHVLSEDSNIFKDINKQVVDFEKEMTRVFESRLSDFDKIFLQMENRGQKFFDETIRARRLPDILRKNVIQEKFEKSVIADVPIRVEHRVERLLNWFVQANLKQWKQVISEIGKHQEKHQDQVQMAEDFGSFYGDREAFIQKIRADTKKIFKRYNNQGEAKKIQKGLRNAIAATAVLEVGAISLGVLITTMATTLAMNASGILIASLLTIMGFFILPARQRKAKKDLHEKIKEMRWSLINALRTHFIQEIKGNTKKIYEITNPYVSNVQDEEKKILNFRHKLNEFEEDLGAIRKELT